MDLRGLKGLPEKIISTLDSKELIIADRRVGNTTRLVDFAIQKLFEGYLVIVQDHYYLNMGSDIKNTIPNKDLLKRIINRLFNEHMISDKDIIVDRNRLTIKLKNNGFIGDN